MPKHYATYLLSAFALALAACQSKQPDLPLVGTWKLVAATTTEKDTTFSTFDPSHAMIKVINPTHFAFLNHNTTAKDSATHEFTAGGGTYSLADSTYTEHLAYFTDKQWENHDFSFVVSIHGDTLVQKGVEKVEKLGIDRVITETYVRVKE